MKPTSGDRDRTAAVTGGAGFIGSHLCEALLARGWQVVALDNLLTGSRENLAALKENASFSLVEQDVTEALHLSGPVQAVFHLASPASPADFERYPLEILAAGSAGTRQALESARGGRARFLLASSSEVYGDPAVTPQVETYRGNVNPVGPRSAYDEAKRFAEALTVAYRRKYGLETRIARIFNTYGPRMRRGDGRVVPAFLEAALSGEPLLVHGDGKQTRSFCYVSDLVEGLVRLLESEESGPVNLGNPNEITIFELAETILRITGSKSSIRFAPALEEDPQRRCPDIGKARAALGWAPRVSLDEGLRLTAAWFKERQR